MAGSKKIKFNPVFATQERIIKPMRIEYDERKNKKKIPTIEGLPAEISLKAGEEMSVTKEQFDALASARLILTKEDVKKRDKILKTKTPLTELKKDEYLLLFSEKPEEV